MYSSSLFTVTTSLYLFRGEDYRSLENQSPEGTRPGLLPLPPLVRLSLFLPMRRPPYTAKMPGLLPSLAGVLEKPTATSSSYFLYTSFNAPLAAPFAASFAAAVITPPSPSSRLPSISLAPLLSCFTVATGSLVFFLVLLPSGVGRS
jgi:hypothetical protein